MDPRRALRLDSLLQLIAVALIVVLLNLLAVKHFARLDLTADRVHTLSQAGRTLMARLEKPLVVKVYFTKGLEAPYNNHEQILVDKLQEFRAWSRGRMELTVVDPTGDEELEQEARRLGITPIQYSFRSESRQELRQVYMGAALIYGDEQVTLPAITQVATLEYDLARHIKSLLDDEPRTIGYLVGHEEPDILTARGPLETLRERLGASYGLQAVDLEAQPGVPQEIDALLIVGPQSELEPLEQYWIDQYLMSGRPVAFFLSQYKPNMRTLRAEPVFHGLEGLIGAYGLELNRDLVVDRVQNGKMRFPVRQGDYQSWLPINVPYIPLVTDLDSGSVVVRDLDAMTFPFVSSIDLPESPPAGIELQVLARAGADAGRIKNVKLLDPRAYQRRDPSEEIGRWPVLAVSSGEFESAFAGREVPGTEALELPPRIERSDRTRVVVAGSADFIANNIAFMENLVDWMVQDEDLISIRSKTVQVPTLDPLDSQQRGLVKAANLLIAPLLLMIFGLLRRARRASGGPTT